MQARPLLGEAKARTELTALSGGSRHPHLTAALTKQSNDKCVDVIEAVQMALRENKSAKGAWYGTYLNHWGERL